MSSTRDIEVFTGVGNTTDGHNASFTADVLVRSTMKTFTFQPGVGNEGTKPIISPEFAKTFSFISNTYITPTLCILGLLLNCLGLNTIWKEIKKKQDLVYKYLFALVCFDILFLAVSLVRVIPSIVAVFDLWLSKVIDANMKLGIVYIDMNLTYTARGLVLVMALERLLSLLRPLHLRNMWLSKYPMAVISICFMFNIIFLLPVPVNAQVVTLQDGNQTDYIFKFKNYEHFMATFMIVQVIIHDFLPVTCMVIINTAIPIQYYRITKKRTTSLNIHHGNSFDQQRKITILVLIITFFYILLTVPTVIIKFLQFFDRDYSIHGKYRLVLWFAIDVSNLLSYINAANDFLIYFLVCTSYRVILKRRFCGCCLRVEDQ